MNPKVQQFLYHPATVIISGLACLVIPGLVLTWTHPTWGKTTKVLVSSIFAAFIGFACVGHFVGEREVARFEEGHQLWMAGKKAESVEVYHLLLEDRHMFAEIDQRHMEQLYGRMVEYYLEEGYTDKAREMHEQATNEGYTPTITDDMKSQLALGI